ncbi:hypothetical protein MXD63_34340 [Frankia sp. Cpl3]|uniref:hypothetical protein n=1 Tax=Parafrankia colletiae TaxID=573497 RepID=UPI001041BF3D|nr:hypothetical protein [Parafrankia colletiae]MCK9905081.1 hypothetical protein [Frankia sp. Cpl3]
MSDPLAPSVLLLQQTALANNTKVLLSTALAADAGALGTQPPALVIDQPTAGSTLLIDATPAMPVINCRARISGVNPDPTALTDFSWDIVISETPRQGSCLSAQVVCSNQETGNSTGGSWTPALGFIQGGEARIKVSVTVNGRRLAAEVSVHVRGTNPTPATITAACGGPGSDADQVACHESSRRQFWTDGLPLRGSGGDVGIMQLCNPAATCEQRWNWSANVTRGVALLQTKRAEATVYLNRHAPGGNYPNDGHLTDAEVLQRETLQRYNGGRYWQWDSSGNVWRAQPPNTYVSDVLRCS